MVVHRHPNHPRLERIRLLWQERGKLVEYITDLCTPKPRRQAGHVSGHSHIYSFPAFIILRAAYTLDSAQRPKTNLSRIKFSCHPENSTPGWTRF